MTDVHSPAVRSKNMQAIRSANTKLELLIRTALHKRGFRYRLNYSDLPGKPDLVLKKYKAVIFLHGCFWHQHNCALFKWPASNSEFWKTKLTQNHIRDIANESELIKLGWRTATIWECSLKGRDRKTIDEIIDAITDWLISNNLQRLEVAGKSLSSRKP